MKRILNKWTIGILAILIVALPLGYLGTKRAKSAAPARIEIPVSNQQTLMDAEAELTRIQQILEKQQIYTQGVLEGIAVPLLGREWRKTHKLTKENNRYFFVELTDAEKKQQQ